MKHIERGVLLGTFVTVFAIMLSAGLGFEYILIVAAGIYISWLSEQIR